MLCCKYCRRLWIESSESDEKEVFTETCDNPQCVEYHTEFLNKAQCNEEACPHFTA